MVADALQLPLRSEMIDLIVTSPPYFGMRDYGGGGRQIGNEVTPQEFISVLVRATAEMVRVLRREGSMFVNLGDSYTAYNANRGDGRLQTNAGQSRPLLPRGLSSGGAVRNKSLMLIPERYRIACVDDLGLIARAVIIWRKTPSMPAGRLRDRVRTVHEDWVHLTRVDRYYHNERELRAMDSAGQMPPSVWPAPPFQARGKVDLPNHPAPFSEVWPERFIRGWCPPGGTVLDPFAGSGTTLRAAARLGRRAIGTDLLSPIREIPRQRREG